MNKAYLINLRSWWRGGYEYCKQDLYAGVLCRPWAGKGISAGGCCCNCDGTEQLRIFYYNTHDPYHKNRQVKNSQESPVFQTENLKYGAFRASIIPGYQVF